MSDELLTPRQVKETYGFNEATLRNWRWQNTGPVYIKTAPGRSGRVLYRKSAIERFLDERTVETGSGAA